MGPARVRDLLFGASGSMGAAFFGHNSVNVVWQVFSQVDGDSANDDFVERAFWDVVYAVAVAPVFYVTIGSDFFDYHLFRGLAECEDE